MAPSSSSQHGSQSSPAQETTLPTKRSLRSRSSNAALAGNTGIGDGVGGEPDKDGGGGGARRNSEGGGDNARGNSSPCRNLEIIG